MKVAVVGGGIAGLGAAFRLRERGAEAVLIEAGSEAGGRCASVHWAGAWRPTGAFAFLGSEHDLVARSKALGLHGDAVNLDAEHVFHALLPKGRTAPAPGFSPVEILKCGFLPLGEKAALAKLLPEMARQLARNDAADVTSAAALDEATAVARMRTVAPTFADYVLEPTLQMFCGYEEADYSWAWLVWVMAGNPWAEGWWSYAGKGAGALTQAMAARLAADPGARLELGARVEAVRRGPGGVTVTARRGDEAVEINADAVVMALPAPQIAPLMPDLDAARAAFLAGVGYVGHHVIHLRAEGSAEGLPPPLMPPTREGFRRVSNLRFGREADGAVGVKLQLKGGFCADSRDWSDAAILDAAWDEALRAAPSAAGLRVVDRVLFRNPFAICRREPGFIRRLAAFRALGPADRVGFAGDWQTNSTVGQAHRAGVEAADAVLDAG